MRIIRQLAPSRIGPGLRLAAAGLLLIGLPSCQSSHQPSIRTEANLDPGWPRPNPVFQQVSCDPVKGEIPKLPGAEEYAHDDEGCADCHSAFVKAFLADNVHRNEGCEACHGPASKHAEEGDLAVIVSFKTIKNPAALAEVCLKCHEQNQCTEGARWRTSKHGRSGVTCVSCHRAHYDVPPGTKPSDKSKETARRPGRFAIALASDQAPAGEEKEKPKPKQPSLRGTSNHLGAAAPAQCYRCHGDKADLQRTAGPHQVCGPNGFNCTTCHDPHGNVKEASRKDLCLTCHKGAPTMAWHSSTHAHNGVACTDCHNPHPKACLPQTVGIDHYQVQRPKRLAMAVQEPQACYKCHAKIYGRTQMPSHHPVLEGKMVCSDCHDPHGQAQGNLKEETVNLLCYKCHAEKQGPFAYEHPPVTERCTICHEAHGTVSNKLLRQPPTFLCLRCHSGHNNTQRNLEATPALKGEMFTDCTACHKEIHGSDRPSAGGVGGRFTR